MAVGSGPPAPGGGSIASADPAAGPGAEMVEVGHES